MNNYKHGTRLARLTLLLLVLSPVVASADDDDSLATQITAIHDDLRSSCGRDAELILTDVMTHRASWAPRCVELATLEHRARSLIAQVEHGKLSERDAEKQLTASGPSALRSSCGADAETIREDVATHAASWAPRCVTLANLDAQAQSLLDEVQAGTLSEEEAMRQPDTVSAEAERRNAEKEQEELQREYATRAQPQFIEEQRERQQRAEAAQEAADQERQRRAQEKALARQQAAERNRQVGLCVSAMLLRPTVTGSSEAWSNAALCRLDPQAALKIPPPSPMPPPASQLRNEFSGARLQGEQMSGRNKLCFYNDSGSTVATTIEAHEVCPRILE